MSAFALVTGVLWKAPTRNASASGNFYVTATVRTDDNDRTIFWRVAAFNQIAQTELLHLRVGDAVSVQGAMQAEAYKDAAGDPRLSMRIIADQVLALRQKPMKQAEPPARPLTKEERDRLFPEWP